MGFQMKKLALFLTFFFGCFWLFGYIDYPKTYGQERPELLNEFFASNKINDMLPYSQSQRTPKRKKHDWFRSSDISRNFQGTNGITVWARTYGGSGEDVARSIQQTNEGGYILAGRTRSFDSETKAWLLKLSSAGEIEWQRAYRHHYIHANSVQQTSDGGYVMAGYVSFSDFPYAEFFVLKLFPSGDIEWAHNYEGEYGDTAHLIQQTSDGGYIVSGLTGSFGDPYYKDIWVLKLTSVGNVEWQRAYGGPSYESDWNNETHRVTLLETSDKGYILAGDTQSFGAGRSDIWILKLSSLGDIEWQYTYGGQESETLYRCGPNIQLTSDGGYIVAGDTQSFGAGGIDMWILKLSSDGSIEWQCTYGGQGDERAHSVQLTSDGGYIVAGTTDSFGLGGLDFWLLKLSSDGDIEWQHTYGGEDDDMAKCLYHTDDGGYILAGSTMSFGVGGGDILIFKLSPNGELVLGSEFLIGSSNAMVSDTSVIPADTYVAPIVTTAPAMDTDITAENTSVISNALCWDLNQPPINPSLESEVNRSLFKREAFHTISWSPNPLNSEFDIVEYKIYRKKAEESYASYQYIESVPGNVYEYVDSYLDPVEQFVYAVTSVDSNSNESPKSEHVSTIAFSNNTENSNLIVSDTRTSSSDKRITRLDTKPSEDKKNISKNILASSKPRSKSPNKSQVLVQPPTNVSLIRGEIFQTIYWEPMEHNVIEYRIYRKCAAEDDESYMLIGCASGTESKFIDYVPNPFKEFMYAVTAVGLDGSESQKSKATRR